MNFKGIRSEERVQQKYAKKNEIRKTSTTDATITVKNILRYHLSHY